MWNWKVLKCESSGETPHNIVDVEDGGGAEQVAELVE